MGSILVCEGSVGRLGSIFLVEYSVGETIGVNSSCRVFSRRDDGVNSCLLVFSRRDNWGQFFL